MKVLEQQQKERIAILRDRGACFAKARRFFAEREVLEVDCPILSVTADVAAHIDLISALYNQQERCYLHPSAEYGMKCLLSEGIGDIYQLSHVFRDGENGRHHNPEFTMVEWYRLNLRFVALIEETFDFIELFLGNKPRRILSYREAFQHYAGFDYVHISKEKLLAYIRENEILAPKGVELEEKDTLLTLILSSTIEKQLGKGEFCALAWYPATQAALAQTTKRGDEDVAERFEIYYEGIELCNGFNELTDPVEQRKRIEESNAKRVALGKEALPVNHDFLAALERGLPPSCGVAVGFDRLMMLRHKTNTLSHVIPFRFKGLMLSPDTRA